MAMADDKLAEIQRNARRRLRLADTPAAIQPSAGCASETAAQAPSPPLAETVYLCKCGKPQARFRALCEDCIAARKREAAEREEARRQLEEAARQRQAAQAEARRVEALEALRADLPAAVALCGCPRRHLTASFDNCPDLPRATVERVRAWAEAPADFLLLTGGVGSGKTYLAVAALRFMLERGIVSPPGWTWRCKDGVAVSAASRLGQATFVDERTYLSAVRNGFDRGGDDSLARRVESAAFLIFDDLGAASATEWSRGELSGLLCQRHADQRPAILTSNLSLNEIAKALDSRLASRIAAGRNVVALPKRDLRVTGTRPARGTGHERRMEAKHER